MGSQLKPVAEEERKRLLLGRKPASLGTKMGVFGGRITTVLVLVLMAHAGLYWEGTNACSDRTVARAIAALSPDEIETRVAHIDDNKVEIEFELRPVQKQQEKLNEVENEERRRRRKKMKLNNAQRRQNRPRRNWILLRPGQLVRPRVHPSSNKHYLTIGGIGAI